MWVDGVSILKNSTPTSCRADWTKPCTVAFPDKSFWGPQVIALQTEDFHASGNSADGGSYCTDTHAAGLALVCNSSDPSSTWNSVQSDTVSWSSTSTDTRVTGTQLRSFILSESDSDRAGWANASATSSRFTCAACTAAVSTLVPARTYAKVWGAGCKRYAIFRKVVPPTCTDDYTPPAPTEPPPCVPAESEGRHNVTCTFSVDNSVTGVWIDEVDVLSITLPKACRTNWQTPCTLTFEDKSFLAPQLIAFEATNYETQRTTHCTSVNAAGVAMMCQSTAPQSSWNDVQSDYTWESYSNATASLNASFTKFGFDSSSAGWGTSVQTLSKFTCSACDGGWRSWEKMWGKECNRYAYFRKVVPAACEGPSNASASATTTTTASSSSSSTSTPARDCRGTWGGWSTCDVTCGAGQQSRTFTETAQQAGTGQTCTAQFGVEDDGSESQSCSPGVVCPVDCDGAWDGWSACPVSCGGGQRQRTFVETQAAVGSGQTCEARFGTSPQSRSCATSACSMGTVICTFTADNAVNHVFVNGQPLGVSPSTTCLEDWSVPCVSTFNDTSHFGQLLAIHADERTEDGKVVAPLNYCTYYFFSPGTTTKNYYGAALFLACSSTSASSPWNFVVSGTNSSLWSSASVSTAYYAANYDKNTPSNNGPADSAGKMWYESGFDTAAMQWGAPQMATAASTCAACTRVNRALKKMWADGCEDHGFFRATTCVDNDADGICDAVDVDCAGSWSEWAACSPCGEVNEARTFTVTRAQRNAGVACTSTNGDVEYRGA
jgi:hypothetical protein